ncbi:hypothetical protein V6N13_025344 [Hibiscus sabdariffa]|uniref:Uncharacterized protein n=1 Tax=Hibiscus sabdariffa TaxID=183260 RepID=A0ABR2BKM1_9ROSI
MIEVEVGNEIFEIRVSELATHRIVLGHKPFSIDKNQDRTSAMEVEDSSTTFSARKEKTISSKENNFGIDEAINAVCMGMSPHKYADTHSREEYRFCRESDIAGCSSKIHNDVSKSPTSK